MKIYAASENGSDGIAERGTHESLLKKGGIYARYYNM